MPVHPFDQNVLGGVGRLRCLPINSDNFCDNRYFDSNTSGWVMVLGSAITREVDADAFATYMLKVASVIPANIPGVGFGYNLGEAHAGKIFFAKFRAKFSSARQFKVQFFNGDGGFGETTLEGDTQIREFVVVSECLTNGSSPNYQINFLIQGAIANTDAPIYFHIDSLWFGEADDDYTFPAWMEDESLTFDPVNYGGGILWNGVPVSYTQRWRPDYACRFEILNAVHESWRQYLATSQFVLVIPHDDVDWGFIGYWTKEIRRNYPFNRYIGHKSVMMFEGADYMAGGKGSLPELQAQGTLYIEDELLVS